MGRLLCVLCHNPRAGAGHPILGNEWRGVSRAVRGGAAAAHHLPAACTYCSNLLFLVPCARQLHSFPLHPLLSTAPPLPLHPGSLALLIPAAQSLIADLHPARHRGRAFGLLHFTGGVGGLVGSLLGTNLGHLRPFGMEGWRLAFVLVALASWLIGALTLCCARDPRAQQEELRQAPHLGRRGFLQS